MRDMTNFTDLAHGAITAEGAAAYFPNLDLNTFDPEATLAAFLDANGMASMPTSRVEHPDGGWILDPASTVDLVAWAIAGGAEPTH